MDLKFFAENIHNDHLSLKAAKIRQRNMEDMIWKLKNNTSDKKKYKTHKTDTLFNAKEYYKGRKRILIAFENGTFSLPKKYPSDTPR